MPAGRASRQTPDLARRSYQWPTGGVLSTRTVNIRHEWRSWRAIWTALRLGTACKIRTVRFFDGRCLGRLASRDGPRELKNAKNRQKTGQSWSCLAVLSYLVGRDIYRYAHENVHEKEPLYIYLFNKTTRQRGFWGSNPRIFRHFRCLGRCLGRQDSHPRARQARRRVPPWALHRLLHAVMQARAWDGIHTGDGRTSVADALIPPASATEMHTCTLIPMLVFIPCEALWSKRR